MNILRKVGAVGLLVATSAAITVSAAGSAGADPRYYNSYGDCMTAGNILAQQGRAHVFRCEPAGGQEGGGGPTGSQPYWALVIES